MTIAVNIGRKATKTKSGVYVFSLDVPYHIISGVYVFSVNVRYHIISGI